MNIRRNIMCLVAIAAVLLVARYAVLHVEDINARVASAATSAPASPLRSVNTPKIYVADMKLKPNSCKPVVKDAKAGLVLPDPKCTPGAIDPAVTQANIKQTICVVGYTDTVRPSTSKTGPAKKTSLLAYGMSGLPAAQLATVEYDHHISLQLGGASTESNLWPQPNKEGAKSVVNPKDAVETKLKKAVCSGKIPLRDAQVAIATDWTTALAKTGVS